MTTEDRIAHTGLQLPAIGFGTWRLWGAPAVTAVSQAIDAGYRLIDTAKIYENEGAVGRGISESGVSRAELVVTSKLPPSDQAPRIAVSTIAESVYRLGLDFIDLYLIHWRDRTNDRSVETWEALIEARERGLVRAIGVSNFREDDLERLRRATGVLPEVNQIETHPYRPRDELVRYHERHAIVTEAWAPFGNDAPLLDDPVIGRIARDLGATPAQVVLAWTIGRGVVPIPKSGTPERQRENFEATNLLLSDSHRAEISELARRAD